MKCKPLNLTCCSVRPAAISSMHVQPRWERCKSNLYKYFTSVFPRSQLLALKLSHLCCQNNYMLTKQLGGKHNKISYIKLQLKTNALNHAALMINTVHFKILVVGHHNQIFSFHILFIAWGLDMPQVHVCVRVVSKSIRPSFSLSPCHFTNLSFSPCFTFPACQSSLSQPFTP